MDKKSALDALSAFRTKLEANGIKVEKLILFGSFARGTSIESSDIDVVVISDDFSGKDYWERVDVLADAIYHVFEPIEATAMTQEEWENGESLICDFAGDGDIVYAA